MAQLFILKFPATTADVEKIVRLANEGGPDGKARTNLPSVLPDGYFRAFDHIQYIIPAPHIPLFNRCVIVYFVNNTREVLYGFDNVEEEAKYV